MCGRTLETHFRLNKNGIKFDGKKKKFFTSTRRKPISEMDCYNCGELGHLAHQCTKPKKDKYKNKYKGKKDDSSNEEEDEKKKNKPYKKRDGKKDFHKKKKSGRHTSSVIGSRTLIHQVDHPMMIVTMRRWSPLLLILHLYRHHYTTAYLQRPTVGRYKSVQRPTVGRYIHIASDLTRGYKWRR